MRILFVVFLLACVFINPVFLFAQEESDLPAENANKELEVQLRKSNAEVEQIRLEAEEQVLKDRKTAEKDLEIAIEEFQREKFPEEVKEEASPEVK